MVGKSLIKKISFFGLFSAYFTGGINHFIMPGLYEPLIPPYLVFIEELNYLSGFFEILFALGLLFEKTRTLSCYGIMLMLLAFLPAHIYFIEMGSCISDSICFDPWVAWVRLIAVHPFLIWWAYSNRNFSFGKS